MNWLTRARAACFPPPLHLRGLRAAGTPPEYLWRQLRDPANLQAAFDWLGAQREGAPDASDRWDDRAGWPERLPELRGLLQTGRFRFAPVAATHPAAQVIKSDVQGYRARIARFPSFPRPDLRAAQSPRQPPRDWLSALFIYLLLAVVYTGVASQAALAEEYALTNVYFTEIGGTTNGYARDTYHGSNDVPEIVLYFIGITSGGSGYFQVYDVGDSLTTPGVSGLPLNNQAYFVVSTVSDSNKFDISQFDIYNASGSVASINVKGWNERSSPHPPVSGSPAHEASFSAKANSWTTISLTGFYNISTLTIDFTDNTPLYFNQFYVSKTVTYTITYNANGAVNGSIPDKQTKIHNVDLGLASNSGSLAKTGFTFSGWNTNADGSGTNYAAGATYTTNAPLTLYAKWTANQYTATFNKQEGTGGSTTVTATYGAAMPTATAPSRIGYAFGGYYTGTEGGGTQYYTAAMASARTWDLVSDNTLYAQWTGLHYGSSNTGNWSAIGTWKQSADGSTNWTAATAAPNSASLGIAIQTGHTVTVNSAVTIDQTAVVAGGTLAVADGVTLTVANGDGIDLTVAGTLSVAGALTLAAEAELKCDGSCAVADAGSMTLTGTVSGTGSMSTSGTGPGTVTYNGTADQNILKGSYPNLTLGGGGTKTLLGDVSVTGALLIEDGTTLAAGTHTITFNGSTPQSIPAGTYHHLVLSGAGAKTLDGDVSVTGDLTIDTGTTLDTGAHALRVAGHWTNNGTFTANAGTVTFDGSGDSTLSGTASTTFHNLTLNKTGGTSATKLTLVSAVPAVPVFVTNALTLTQGTLDLSAWTSDLLLEKDLVIGANGRWIKHGTASGVVEFSCGACTVDDQSTDGPQNLGRVQVQVEASPP